MSWGGGNMEGTKAELFILSLTLSKETLLCAESHTSFAKKLYVLGATALGLYINNIQNPTVQCFTLTKILKIH